MTIREHEFQRLILATLIRIERQLAGMEDAENLMMLGVLRVMHDTSQFDAAAAGLSADIDQLGDLLKKAGQSTGDEAQQAVDEGTAKIVLLRTKLESVIAQALATPPADTQQASPPVGTPPGNVVESPSAVEVSAQPDGVGVGVAGETVAESEAEAASAPTEQAAVDSTGAQTA